MKNILVLLFFFTVTFLSQSLFSQDESNSLQLELMSDSTLRAVGGYIPVVTDTLDVFNNTGADISVYEMQEAIAHGFYRRSLQPQAREHRYGGFSVRDVGIEELLVYEDRVFTIQTPLYAGEWENNKVGWFFLGLSTVLMVVSIVDRNDYVNLIVSLFFFLLFLWILVSPSSILSLRQAGSWWQIYALCALISAMSPYVFWRKRKQEKAILRGNIELG